MWGVVSVVHGADGVLDSSGDRRNVREFLRTWLDARSRRPAAGDGIGVQFHVEEAVWTLQTLGSIDRAVTGGARCISII